jgi:prophage regulatory protein
MRILRFPELKRRIGYSRMHIDRLERAGMFPKRIRLGSNSVGWIEAEIDQWLKEKVLARKEA